MNIILILVMKVFHPGRFIFNHFSGMTLLLPTAKFLIFSMAVGMAHVR